MPWPAVLLRVTFLLLFVTSDLLGGKAEENVGCLFSERLCLEEEWCYDDLAFGRCTARNEDLKEEDLYRYNLEREGLHELSAELRRLFALGYRWSHGYTQCRLQAMLFAFKYDLGFDPNACSHLSDNDLEGALKALEGQVDIDPREIAIIRYTPSVGDPHANYADEVFYPPIKNHEQEELREKILSPYAIDLDLPDPYADYTVAKRTWLPQMQHRSPRMPDIMPPNLQSLDSRDRVEFLKNNYDISSDDMNEINPILRILSDMQLSPMEMEEFLSGENRPKLNQPLRQLDEETKIPDSEKVFSEMVVRENEPNERFTMNYNTPDNFRNGWESRDALQRIDEEVLPESRVYSEEDDGKDNDREYGSGHDLNSDVDLYTKASADSQVFNELNRQMKNVRNQLQPAVYSEGGVVWSDPIDNLKETTQEEASPLISLDELLFNYNMGFKRPERLDVKKPGPPFDSQRTDTKKGDENKNMEKNHRQLFNNEVSSFPDQDYVQIQLQNRLRNRSQSESVIASIRKILKLDSTKITGKVGTPTQVILLRVDPLKSETGLTNKELSDIIDSSEFKAELEKATGMGINSVEYIRPKNHSKEATNENNGPDILPSMMKKEPKNIPNQLTWEYDPSNSVYNQQDYVYITIKNGFTTWKQGSHLIRNISDLLHLEPGTFVDGRVNPKSVVFKVKPNSRGLTAGDVAKNIENIKDKLEGVEIISVGVGTKENLQTIIAVPLANDDQFYIVIFLVCGVLAAMIVATVLLIIIRKHLRSKEKLQGLSRPETEASKDYQDLCRARMAAKPQPASDTIHGRITSLSRESEQSPSSRSSTSSWSEEPALHNMDISTGHMVLTYMEDHLKNKDRLEQEWVALCAYVAEPCETSIALKKENKEKNRYADIVPYDHARVVLNELSNANGSDYINASSITDHDPRNPAYIATQGPLPHTAPEFWQLIWEQGAVVIVMLTRLTEGGNAMCHRYWPEEGSELYHIYEVHLVSEHIWCDDYLVRSFYLKNLRTGETRTVTQFHFLSWPEGGVPSSTKALLEFRRKVNKSYRGRSCPIVVHCSDGSGRTGTYCLIDMVLSRMAKGAKEIDIAATLEHLRDQRPKMVATKQQFEFVLTAVAEEVHAILKALPVQPQTSTSQEKDK